ncbi:hypothetical protein B296_00001604 [Ensete ventricosum]|uniref:Uncharacterized protein n=1 Tax=Ensete ventricosum TaxID=4639 RepID=A0A427AFA9_ENSVE|nr:hypothetical protein B296_00001604 [Ensete ventricosum]
MSSNISYTFLQDRSLDFHALCALYAVTGDFFFPRNLLPVDLAMQFCSCSFAGAAQSLGAGALLVNPWNITEVAASIGYALNMSPDEREKRHRHNYAHVTTHTAQDWAETFVRCGSA